MTARVFISRDSGALCVGADEVARALFKAAEKRGLDVEIVRTGSRGMYWLEPTIEVERPEGRVGYGPTKPSDIDSLLDAGMLEGGKHPLFLGLVEDIPFFKKQTRLTFARVGIIDPRSLEDYKAHGGYKGLEKALAVGPEAIVEEVVNSGLRGRGGAGFPTGIKWRTVAQTPPQQKYIVCNADEGDSGTFADRMIMEGDPLVLIEGMTIAGIATGATYGYIYIRSEYPHAVEAMEIAIRRAREGGMLGANVAGSQLCLRHGGAGRRRRLCLRRGDLASRERRRQARRSARQAAAPCPYRPLRQADRHQQCAVACVRADHHERRRRLLPRFRHGPVARHHAHPARRQYQAWRAVRDGLRHQPRRARRRHRRRHALGRPVRAVQVGGPLGAYFPRALFDTPFDYEAFTAADGLIGHGGIVVFDDTVDMAKQARFAMEFCAIESCGKCTPCRIGSARGVELVDKIMADEDRAENITVLEDLCNTMKFGSLCALGGFTPYPVMSALTHFPEDFGASPKRLQAAE